jgi:hypothetical protein
MAGLTIKDFKVASCQISFFHNIILIPRTVLLKEILHKFGSQFDGDQISFPIPDDAPADIPRIILTSRKPNIRLEVSLIRTNLYRFESQNDPELDIYEFYNSNQKNYKDYLGLLQTNINRVAGVIQRYAFCDEPGIFLSRHFCQSKWDKQPFNRPESFELHAQKAFNLYGEKSDELMVNSWVRCKSGLRKVEAGEPTKIILVEQDLNTRYDESVRKIFSMAEIDRFFSTIPLKFDEIMKLYFPEI